MNWPLNQQDKDALFVIGVIIFAVEICLGFFLFCYHLWGPSKDTTGPLCFVCGASATRKSSYSGPGGVSAVWLCDSCTGPKAISRNPIGAVKTEGGWGKDTFFPYFMAVFFMIFGVIVFFVFFLGFVFSKAH